MKDVSPHIPINSRSYNANAPKSLVQHQLALRSFCNSPLWTAALRSELPNSIKVTRLSEWNKVNEKRKQIEGLIVDLR